MAVERSLSERPFFYKKDPVKKSRIVERETHIVFHNQREEGAKKSSKIGSHSASKRRNDICCSRYQHRVVFRLVFWRLFILVLIWVLLAKCLVF
jgi:hypothetical protein